MKLPFNPLWPVTPWMRFEGDGGDAGGGGGEVVVPDWLGEADGIDDLMGDDASKNILIRYDSHAAALKGLVEKEQTIRSGFKMPETLSDEQFEDVQNRVNIRRGVPEKPEEYEMVRPKEIDDDIELSEQFGMELRAFAKASNMGKKEAQGLSELLLHGMQRAKEAASLYQKESFEKSKLATETSLKQYFGPAEYEKIAGLQDSFVESRAVDVEELAEFNKVLDSTGLRHNTLLNKLLGDAARMANILEGSGKMLDRFNQTGNVKQSEAAKRAAMYPKTPQSLGGSAPG